MTTACWVSGWGVHPLPDSTSRALCGRATSRRKCPGTVRFLGNDIHFLRSTNKWKARAGGPIVMVGRREIESRAGLSDRFLRRCLLRPPGGNFPDRLLPRVELARTRFLGHYLDGDRLCSLLRGLLLACRFGGCALLCRLGTRSRLLVRRRRSGLGRLLARKLLASSRAPEGLVAVQDSLRV